MGILKTYLEGGALSSFALDRERGRGVIENKT